METYTCYDYENEINPLYFGPDANCNWQGGLNDLKSCSIDELEKIADSHLNRPA